MRILILGSGRSYHATRWANALRARGHEVGFASCHRFERPLDEGIPRFSVYRKAGLGYFLGAPELRRVISEWKPDIVHAHYASGYAALSRLSGFTPRLVSIYGSDIYAFPKKSPVHRLILAYGLGKADAVLSTSEAMADEFLRVFPKAERPLVTPFGVDIKRFKPAAKDDRNKDSIDIGLVKKLEDAYGIDVLLKAFRILRDDHPGKRIKLYIAGTGSKENHLKELCRSLGIDSDTIFLGPIPNSTVPAFLAKLDFFVVPSRLESFGVAAVEAQSCGLPVIASDAGGLPEVVVDGESGIIVSRDDAEALARAMDRLYKDSELRAKMGQAARLNVTRRFDWNKNVDTMLDIYKRFVSSRGGRG